MIAQCGPFTCTKHRLLLVAFAALALILLIDFTRTRSWRRRQAALSDVVGAQVTVVMMSKSNGLRKNQLALVSTYANHPLVDKFVWVWNVRTDEALLRSLLPYTRGTVRRLASNAHRQNPPTISCRCAHSLTPRPQRASSSSTCPPTPSTTAGW